MELLTDKEIAKIKTIIPNEPSIVSSLPTIIGGLGVAQGLWRFFSPIHPSCSINVWNEEWCKAWGIQGNNLFVFGEDVFGNQLLITLGQSTVYLCDHENGSCHDLELDVSNLLESVTEHGLDWIDFYSNGSLRVPQDLRASLTWEQHLHWIHPLILGGATTPNNILIIDRFRHLHGHVKLWNQVSHLPPDTEISVQ